VSAACAIYGIMIASNKFLLHFPAHAFILSPAQHQTFEHKIQSTRMPPLLP
jgi:hypothetical protein